MIDLRPFATLNDRVSQEGCLDSVNALSCVLWIHGSRLTKRYAFIGHIRGVGLGIAILAALFSFFPIGGMHRK